MHTRAHRIIHIALLFLLASPAFAQQAPAPPCQGANPLLQNLANLAIVAPAAFGAWQLAQMRKAADHQRIVAMIERTTEHNWRAAEDQHRLDAIATFEGLSVPATDDEKKKYWASRLVHLSHLNLLWQAWELSGRKDLPPGLNGWNRFAGVFARKLKLYQEEEPDDLALRDLRKAIQPQNGYEVVPSEFVEWLRARARGTTT